MGKIIIAGGTGLIGSALSAEFQKRGHRVLLLSRTAGEGRLPWNGDSAGDWGTELVDCTAIINLAGSPISVKFSSQNRARILSSRVGPTGAIGAAIQANCDGGNQPLWINASAVGFYGNRGAEICTESSDLGEGFLPSVCQAWEEACLDHPAQCPKAIVRIGVVLSAGGGAFPILQRLTQAFLGGHLGNGLQSMSWIHVDDLVNLFTWLIDNSKAGIYNGTTPNPVTNRELMTELRKAEHRPWSPPVPAPILRLVGKTVGPDSSLLLDSLRAVPQRAMDEGFEFEFLTVGQAIADLCTKAAPQGTL